MKLFNYEYIKLIYVAHPFGGLAENLEDAEFIVSMLSEVFDAVFWAPWIPMCKYWKNESTSLDRGLLLDKHAVKMSTEIWVCHNPLSARMTVEENVATIQGVHCEYFKNKIDLIQLCENPDSDRARHIKRRLRDAIPYCITARERKLQDENQALKDQIELIERNTNRVATGY